MNSNDFYFFDVLAWWKKSQGVEEKTVTEDTEMEFGISHLVKLGFWLTVAVINLENRTGNLLFAPTCAPPSVGKIKN